MAAIFDGKEYLFGEVGDREQVHMARSQLEEAINELRHAGEEGIKRLDGRTDEMISLVSGLGEAVSGELISLRRNSTCHPSARLRSPEPWQ